MGKKLFVGRLSYSTTDESLRTAFEAFGEVEEARVIYDRTTGDSRGFGFVSYVDESNSKIATEKMDGAMLDGRTIRVNEAEDRRGPGGDRGDRGGRGGGGGRGRGRAPEVHTRGRGRSFGDGDRYDASGYRGRDGTSYAPAREDRGGGDGEGGYRGRGDGDGYRPRGDGGGYRGRGDGGGYRGRGDGGGYRGRGDGGGFRGRGDGGGFRGRGDGGGFRGRGDGGGFRGRGDGGGFRGRGGPGGGGGGGFGGDAAEEDWGADRRRRTSAVDTKKKKKPTEDDFGRVRAAPKKDRRQSGRSWRDYDAADDAGEAGDVDVGAPDSGDDE